MHTSVQPFNVSATTSTIPLAGAIAGEIRKDGKCVLQAIGAAAVNQALKAVAASRSFLEPDGIHVYLIPSFVNVMMNGKEITAMKFEVEAFDNECVVA